jgi:ADP-ribose pyrophosphatase
MAKKHLFGKGKTLSSQEVYRGPVFWVTTDQVCEPGGIEARRDVVRHTGSVVILAIDTSQKEPRVLLEHQYRHTAGKLLWELPAGRIDPGETELAAARRELIEETGYRARHWKRVLRFYASPGFVAETMAIYLAEGLIPGPAQPEEDELIEVKLVPLSKAVQMVRTNSIQDAKTISGILWAERFLRRKARK